MRATNWLTADQATMLRSAMTIEMVEHDRLAQILDEYLQAIEKGEPITPEGLLARHPADAEKLKEYLQGLEIFHAAAKAESVIVPASPFSTKNSSDDASANGPPNRISTPASVRSLAWSSIRSFPRLLIGDRDPTSTDSFSALRRSRIRAAALCCTIWWSTIIVGPLLQQGGWSWVPALVTLGLAGIFIWLTVKRSLNPTQLRVAE